MYVTEINTCSGNGESNEYGLGPALKYFSVVGLEAECELFTPDEIGRTTNLKSYYMILVSALPFTFFFSPSTLGGELLLSIHHFFYL